MNVSEQERELMIVRRLAAARQLVWRAWTDPAVMVRWMHPHDVGTVEGSVAVDLRVGGDYRFTMADASGVEYPSGGEYIEVREPESLRCSWGAPGEPVAELSVVLREIGEGITEMTFRLVGHPDDSGRADSVWGGWREALDELAAEVERTGDG